MDESAVAHQTSENKAQSKQWVRKGNTAIGQTSEKPRMATVTDDAGFFFLIMRALFTYIVPRNTKLNGDYVIGVLKMFF